MVLPMGPQKPRPGVKAGNDDNDAYLLLKGHKQRHSLSLAMDSFKYKCSILKWDKKETVSYLSFLFLSPLSLSLSLSVSLSLSLSLSPSVTAGAPRWAFCWVYAAVWTDWLLSLSNTNLYINLCLTAPSVITYYSVYMYPTSEQFKDYWGLVALLISISFL